MTIKTKLKQRIPQIEIDLDGPQGNVFFLIGTAKNLACQLGMNHETIIKQMRGGNYKQAVRIFDAYFGEFVTLYTENEELLN